MDVKTEIGMDGGMDGWKDEWVDRCTNGWMQA